MHSPRDVRAPLSRFPRHVRTGLWRWVKVPGLERFELRKGRAGWALRGTIIALPDSGAVEVVYTLFCDPLWQTKQADILLSDAHGQRISRIRARNGRWYENGREKRTVRGCVDIDLGWSPSTNTLPIRRLRLAVGQRSEPLTMAWVRFPDLTVETLPQQYERLSERSYQYTSRGGGFTARLDVDDDGLVVDYEGLWQRLPER